ncbi:TlyA family RNA methyltransferase [Ancylobacter sp. 6x-1]|uniref:TlyA family RNA methyltransferase n=1 Tax=Ancylobacter crimeensis TaxID=2579147 RepID=A0ABT0D7S0_9HYPH|nr:TlyA family RNA methyltransferase [Ancylobacter crimeensis]
MTETGEPTADTRRRQRADRLLVELGLYESRARAQAAIAAGCVTVNGRRLTRPADLVSPDAQIEAQEPYAWVSRGGLKLEAALEAGQVSVAGLDALDVGASTGGFTEVLLARGARRVYAVDVGRDQLHPRLRARPEVMSLEAIDIRALPDGVIAKPVGIIVIDVSFIRLEQVLPAALRHAAPDARLIALVKPQFEVGRDKLSKGGIVKDPAARQGALDHVVAVLAELGWRTLHILPSPIAGGDGNEESLVVAAPAAIRAG